MKISKGTWCMFWNEPRYEVVIERYRTKYGDGKDLRHVTMRGGIWDFCEPLSDMINDLLNYATQKQTDWLPKNK